MKIATSNVNGVNGHLPVLVRWLTSPIPSRFLSTLEP
jgi:hypothetical protein